MSLSCTPHYVAVLPEVVGFCRTLAALPAKTWSCSALETENYLASFFELLPKLKQVLVIYAERKFYVQRKNLKQKVRHTMVLFIVWSLLLLQVLLAP